MPGQQQQQQQPQEAGRCYQCEELEKQICHHNKKIRRHKAKLDEHDDD